MKRRAGSRQPLVMTMSPSASISNSSPGSSSSSCSSTKLPVREWSSCIHAWLFANHAGNVSSLSTAGSSVTITRSAFASLIAHICRIAGFASYHAARANDSGVLARGAVTEGSRLSFILFPERRIQQKVHSRWPSVAGHEALAEISREVVVGRGRARLHDSTDGRRESLLHFQARKRIDDLSYLRFSHRLVTPTSPIAPHSRGAQRDLCLLVQANRRRGVECDPVPDQLGAALIEPFASRELSCRICPLHFKSQRAAKRAREAQIV